jgi:plasmid maintenance system antidote protein VapI
MLGTELAYVRAKLEPLDAAGRKAVAKSIEVHPKTLDRIVSRKTQFGRTDTIGKIAMYFRTKEKRKQ